MSTCTRQLLLCAGLACASCSLLRRHGEATESHPLSPQGKLLASRSAFELTASENGAALAWSPRDKGHGALLLSEFAPDGVERAQARALLAPAADVGDVSELGLVSNARQLGLAWLEKSWGKARLRAIAGAANEAKLTPVELSESSAPTRGERGNFAIVEDRAQAGALSVLGRAEKAVCVESDSHDCSRFAWWRLSAGRAEARGFPLSVPSPCGAHALELLNEPRGMHYAVCSGGSASEAVTTLFTIQREPAYARADKLPKSCNPVGLFEHEQAVWLVVECGEQRRAVRVNGDNAKIELQELSSPRLSCVEGRAELHAGPIQLTLSEPRAGLSALLPRTIAPRESRAVWCGSALLVAATHGDVLELTRYACEGNALRQLAPSQGKAN
ncbi:MAG: hypothetical protein QM756_39485 [Polyangiaceae bacterium]